MFKKYVALDVGDVRIGVAKSDIMGILATPLEVIDRRKVKAVKRIEEILIQENTKSLVIGIPKSLDGTEKRQAEKVREFIEKLNKSIEGLEIFEVDERLTTVSADRLLNETNKKGALENVIIDALKDIPEEKELVDEVIQFVDSLKARLVPELNQINKANKAAVGTFFSVRNPKDAMRSFGTFISKIDWSKSESLKNLFLPFMYLGEEKE